MKLRASTGDSGLAVNNYVVLPTSQILVSEVTFDVVFSSPQADTLTGNVDDLLGLNVLSLDLKAPSGPLLKIDFSFDCVDTVRDHVQVISNCEVKRHRYADFRDDLEQAELKVLAQQRLGLRHLTGV